MAITASLRPGLNDVQGRMIEAGKTWSFTCARSWRAPMKVADIVGRLDVDTDSAGNGHLVWSTYDTTRGLTVLRGSRYTFLADEWSPPGLLYQGAFGWWDLAVRPDGIGIALWGSGINRLLSWSTVAANAQVWSAPPEQLTKMTNVRRPRVVTLAGGEAMVVWLHQGKDPGEDKLIARRWRGASSAGPTWTIDSGAHLRHSRQRFDLAADALGNAFLTWKVVSKSMPYVRLKVSRYAGAAVDWTSPVDLGTSTYALTHYQLDVSKSGEAVVVKPEQYATCCAARYYQPATSTWTQAAPVPMGTISPNDLPAGLIKLRPKGTLLMLRRDKLPSRLWFTKGSVGSSSWSKPLLMHQTNEPPNTLANRIENLFMDTDADDNLFATWGVRSADGSSDRVYCRIFHSASSTWGPTAMVAPVASYSQPQALSVAPGGTAIIAYFGTGPTLQARVYR